MQTFQIPGEKKRKRETSLRDAQCQSCVSRDLSRVFPLLPGVASQDAMDRIHRAQGQQGVPSTWYRTCYMLLSGHCRGSEEATPNMPPWHENCFKLKVTETQQTPLSAPPPAPPLSYQEGHKARHLWGPLIRIDITDLPTALIFLQSPHVLPPPSSPPQNAQTPFALPDHVPMELLSC